MGGDEQRRWRQQRTPRGVAAAAAMDSESRSADEGDGSDSDAAEFGGGATGSGDVGSGGEAGGKLRHLTDAERKERRRRANRESGAHGGGRWVVFSFVCSGAAKPFLRQWVRPPSLL